MTNKEVAEIKCGNYLRKYIASETKKEHFRHEAHVVVHLTPVNICSGIG